MSKKRTKYTKEFKTESVEYLLKSGKFMKEVKESLGVDYWLLSKWNKSGILQDKKVPIVRDNFSGLSFISTS